MDVLGMTITLGSVITIVGALIALSNFFSGRSKKDKDDEARLVRIEASLARIEENTSNLRNRVDDHDKLLTKHETRITVIEVKQNK